MIPRSKYDFKFKDYSPLVFRYIRDLFHVDSAQYLISLTSKYILSELNTPGKSGSFFYFSQDFKFIIKTIHHSEHKFFLKFLPHYYEHIKNNPNTLISRILGLHRVKLPFNEKIHFIVMGNVFPPNKDIHAQYDLKVIKICLFLKGSTVGRMFDKSKIKPGVPVVLKDLNWIEDGRKFELGPYKRKIFCDQLLKDSQVQINSDIFSF